MLPGLNVLDLQMPILKSDVSGSRDSTLASKALLRQPFFHQIFHINEIIYSHLN